MAVSSEHDLFPFDGDGWGCTNCGKAFMGSSAFLATTFSTECKPVGRPISEAIKASEPKAIPKGLLVYVGGRKVHSTHALDGCNGYLFCRACGAFGGARLELLGDRCSPIADLRADEKDKADQRRRCVERVAKGLVLYPGAARHRFSKDLVPK